MNDSPTADLLTAIRQGIEASGQTLLAEARRTGKPLVTWRDGHVVLIDGDGQSISEGEPFRKSSGFRDQSEKGF